jgi:hypothetical protein
MRRRLVYALTTILVAGLADAACAADPTEPAKSSSSWWMPSWPFSKKETKPPPVSKPAPGISPSKEKADWLRRVAVCDRLRAIAVQTNDEELARKADLLDQRIWEVYRQRTSGSPAGGVDEQVLDRHLGMDTRSPARGVGANSTGRAVGVNRAPAREEQP